MATLYDVAHFCSWLGYTQDMKRYLGIDKASWTNTEFWFPYGVNALYGKRQKTRLQSLCENLYKSPEGSHLHLHLIARIKELLAHKANPNIKDINGLSPLLICVRDEIVVVMNILLDAGADINQKDADGDTALSYATSNNYIDIMKELLNNGANPHINDNNGVSLLQKCSKNGYVEILKILLDAGVDINHKDNKIGDTAIYRAARFNKIDIIKELLKNGANPNIMSDDGDFPLQISACEGYLDIVKVLVNGGVDINLLDNNGLSALDFAVKYGHIDVVKYLREHGAIISNNSFICAIEEGRVNILKHFNKLGVNAPASSVLQAVCENKPKLINLLSKMGGDLNYIDAGIDTPLSIAMYDKSYECMEALCKAGANMNMLNLHTNSPHIKNAIVRGDYKAFQILLDNGVNVNTIINQMPMLHYGILRIHLYPDNDEHKTFVKEIIKRAPDFTLINQYGQDAFEIAKEYELDDIAVSIKRAILIGKKLKPGRSHK